jgi:hypothetical protein
MIKNIIKLFFIGSVLSIPLTEVKEDIPIDILLDGLAIHTDKYGCCSSCGYEYCPSLDNCVRSWETYCQEFQFPYNALWKGAGIIVNNTYSSVNSGTLNTN